MNQNMFFEGSSAAISHTGRVRSNNQDSGYAGVNLFAVADGMGGHAGGDIASAIAIRHLETCDQEFESTDQARVELQRAATSAASDLIRAARERPELSGLGTTVSAIVMVDGYAVIGHIGDSRIYLYRDEELTQITTDHTFVQRLVDSGRITLDEARFHPRRSVLMRVLSDMDIDPELDSFVMPTQPGDRWMLCSDGLSGVVDDPQIQKALALNQAPGRTADRLLKQALDAGAPDNVTLIIVDVGGVHPITSGTATVVGSAAGPEHAGLTAGKPARTSWRHPVRSAAHVPSHFEPASEYFDELIEEDQRRARRRRWAWLAGVVLLLALIAGALYGAYSWTQTRFFVGVQAGAIVVYQGIPQDVGPIVLSHIYEDTGIFIDDLPAFARAEVSRTIPTGSLDDARDVVERLRQSADAHQAKSGAANSSPSAPPATPTPAPTGAP